MRSLEVSWRATANQITAEDAMRRLIDATLDELVRLVRACFEEALGEIRKEWQEQPMKPWLSNDEAMEYLQVSRPTLQRYRDSGKLPSGKIGSKVIYRRDDLDAFVEAHMRKKSLE